MIGLVDLDLQQNTSLLLCPPNVEIMKLANYYKTEENKFCRLIGLDEQELSSYDKIYVFSEAEKRPEVPVQFLRAPNVEFGGTAFTNGEYIPFKNEIIDFVTPKTNFYNEFLKKKAFEEGIKHNVISKFLDSGYYRCRAGESILPIPPLKFRNKQFYIYDKEFFYPGWEKTISRICARSIKNIVTIHPIICRTMTNFFAVRDNPKISPAVSMILNLNIPLNETPYLMKEYKKRLLATVTPASNIMLTLGGSFDTNNQYYKDYIYKLNLLYIFWSHGINLKLKYEYPKIGYTDPLSHLAQLTTTWACGDSCKVKGIAERIFKDTKEGPRPERIEKDKLIELFPRARTLLFQTRETITKGGFWRYEC